MMALERKVFNFMQGNIRDTKIHYWGGGGGGVLTFKAGGLLKRPRVLKV